MVIDDLVRGNVTAAARYRGAGMSVRPRRQLAVVTCMDSRLDIFDSFGLRVGDAHIIRNAGGIVTPDIVRSLALSQRMLGTIEVMVVQHTGCGLDSLDDEAFASQIESETGVRPGWRAGGFTDVDASVRRSVTRLRRSAMLRSTEAIRGFVFDVNTGKVREVEVAPAVSTPWEAV